MFTLAVVNPDTNQVVGALTRTVQLNKNTVDYEAFFNEFDNVEFILDEDNNAIKFNGTRIVDADLFKEIDLVSLSGEDDGVDVCYVFDYNADKNEFYLSIIADTEDGEIGDKWFGFPFMGDDGKMKILTYGQLKKDWRYRGQDNYLLNKELIIATFCSSDGDHQHCEFCWQKFSLNSDDLQNGFCTKDRYNWICEDCFNDFGNIFNWTKVE